MKKGLNSLSFSCLTMHHFGIPSFALSISGFNVLLHFIFFFFSLSSNFVLCMSLESPLELFCDGYLC